MPLDVAVTDKEGQQDSLDLAVIALATADDIEKAMDENPDKRRRPGRLCRLGRGRSGPKADRAARAAAGCRASAGAKSEEGGGDNPFGTVAPRGRVVADGTGRQIFPQQKLLMLRPVKE